MKFKIGQTVAFDVLGTDIKGRGRIMGMSTSGLMNFWIIQICHRPNEYMKNLSDTGIVVQENFIQEYHYADDIYGAMQRAADEIETWPNWKKEAARRDREAAQRRDKEIREIGPNRNYYTQ